SAPASRTERRCSSVEKKPFASTGRSAAARAARRSSRAPPKRSSTRTEIALAPPVAYAGTSSSTSASGRMSPIDGERRLNSAIAARPGPVRASRNRPTSAASPREADQRLQALGGCAGVDGPPGHAQTLAQIGRVAPGRDRARGVEQDRVALRSPVLAGEDRPDRVGVLGRRAPAQLLGGAAGDAQLERVDRALVDLAVDHLADE